MPIKLPCLTTLLRSEKTQEGGLVVIVVLSTDHKTGQTRDGGQRDWLREHPLRDVFYDLMLVCSIPAGSVVWIYPLVPN